MLALTILPSLFGAYIGKTCKNNRLFDILENELGWALVCLQVKIMMITFA